MSAFKSLETALDDIFVKKAPPLPAGGKKALVQYLPYINLVLGIIALLAAYGLYRAAHFTNAAVDYANDLSAAYGGQKVAADDLTLTVWLGIAVLAVMAVLYIAAFPATRDRKKSGWDLMFYALLINVVYGLVSVFTGYGGIGSFIGAVIGSAIGGYLLFQIRASYLGVNTAHHSPATKE